MKKLNIILLLVLGISVSAFAEQKKQFKVTVINLTKGQPLTPPVVAVHAPNYELVHLGQEASQGLGLLATDGKTDVLVSELDATKEVVRSVVGSGVILPGQKQELMVEANNPHFKFTLVSMLARTNDAIAVAKNISTTLKVGQKLTTLASVYDAGVEQNTESCADIPAPPCGSPGVGMPDSANYVRPHEGVLGLGDLTLARDTFASQVAKIIIERVQ